MIRDKKIVPALMFHSVGLENHPWAWSHIAESLEMFEAKIALLSSHGFTGVFWSDLYDHMDGRHMLPDDSILLTFDDGYLDNWIHVYPILKKYDMKGTIFVSPDFVSPSDNIRPNLDDVAAGRCSPNELVVPGFLNWAEMREMEKSGLVDIQSHAMTHTWYFSGPDIVDFHSPHSVTPYPWLFWNVRPERKPFYLVEDQQEFVPWGYPLLEHKKSLEGRRFVPDEAAVKEVTGYVETQGGRGFFDQSDWRTQMERHVSAKWKGGKLPGQYETEEERAARITYELTESKTLIEKNLGKQVDFICWPGGANDEFVQGIARKIGYKSWTLGSRSRLEKRNRPGADPESIKRISTSNRVDIKGRYCGVGSPVFQMWKILEHQGSMIHSVGVKAYKVAALLASLGASK